MSANDVEKIYLQPTPVRIWHWVNAFCIVTLTVTGAQIRFPEYVNLFGTYKSAIMLHNTAGIVASCSFFLWLLYYALVARTILKLYVPSKSDLSSGLVRQAKFYMLTYFLGWSNPHHAKPDDKFNPMQKSAYLVIMFALLPLVAGSGILLINTEPLRELVLLVGGLKFLVAAHFLLSCCMIAFLFIHVYLATLGKTPMAYIKPMWTGWEEVEHHDQSHH